MPDMSPKRITMASLPEDHDEWFTLWAWAKRRSRSALATHTVEARVEANREEIRGIIQRAADRRGISYEEMKRLILKNPRYEWDERGDEESDVDG